MATAENQIVGAQEIEQRALSVPEQARTLKIIDDLTYQRGVQIRNIIKDIRKQINATFDPIIAKANATHKEACAQKKKVEAPLVEGENIINPALAAYDTEIERKRMAEQRRLEEEAKKRAEDEQIAAAEHAEKQGDKVAAEAIISAPVEVAPIIQPVAPRPDGISYREYWSAQVTDLFALVKAVATGQQPVTLLQPDQVALNKMATALKGAMIIPGVRPVCEKKPFDTRRSS